MFLPIGAALVYLLDFARFDPRNAWQVPAIFFAFLWVVALSEEFFFRGLVQRWLTEAVGPWPALIATALVFGAVHLPFRDFPNWKFAALAVVAATANPAAKPASSHHRPRLTRPSFRHPIRPISDKDTLIRRETPLFRVEPRLVLAQESGVAIVWNAGASLHAALRARTPVPGMQTCVCTPGKCSAPGQAPSSSAARSSR